MIRDEELWHRPNPEYPGHDSQGYRNACVPSCVDIVALGDSQTYGYGVAARHAWPRQLEKISDCSVYNMAYGGWGPVHSLLLWDKVLALRPKIVLEGLYSGNDFFDSLGMYRYHQLRDQCFADLITPPLDFSEKRGRLWPLPSAAATAVQSAAEKKIAAQMAAAERLQGYNVIRRSLSSHCALYGLFRRVYLEWKRWWFRDEMKWADTKRTAAADPANVELLERMGFRTAFTPARRLVGLDMDDPRVIDGLRVSLGAVEQMDRLAKADGIRFVVVLIPTKELVFRGYVESPSTCYSKLITDEQQAWQTIKERLDDLGIEYLDVLPSLEAVLVSGVQPYPVGRDGHPNKHGYAAIAAAIDTFLSRGTDVVADGQF